MTGPAPATAAELRTACADLWRDLVEHPFPAAMAAGTLAPETFRWYITQNLHYLPDYARALALGAAGAREAADLTLFARSLVNIVDVEIPQNRALRGAVEARCGAAPPEPAAPATVAYTSWLLAVAARGGPLATYAAILPCAWSYGDIGRHLVAAVTPHPVYADWISFFASDAYDAVVVDLVTATDRALAAAAPADRVAAAETFRTGCRLERQFWDAGLARLTWPDTAPPGRTAQAGHGAPTALTQARP